MLLSLKGWMTKSTSQMCLIKFMMFHHVPFEFPFRYLSTLLFQIFTHFQNNLILFCMLSPNFKMMLYCWFFICNCKQSNTATLQCRRRLYSSLKSGKNQPKLKNKKWNHLNAIFSWCNMYHYIAQLTIMLRQMCAPENLSDFWWKATHMCCNTNTS